jgi:hypothetical protein
MPGPNSAPNPKYKRDTPQYVPEKLAARIEAYQQAAKIPGGHHKPGSQKK